MSNPTILCVDDERNVLLSLRSQLMRFFPECMIEIAESAEEALEVIEDLIDSGRELPLVIADQIMPSMRGDQFLIKLHERYPQILKVMLTGQASAEDVGNIVNRGNLYRFISKPWDENDLQITVSAALESYAKDRTIQAQYLALEQAKLELETLNADLEKQVQDRTQQLQLSEEHYRILSELSPVGIFRNDANGNCTYANAKTLQITGLTLEENLGNGWGKNIHPDDRGWMYDAWTNFVEQSNLGHNVDYCLEHRYLNPDGSTKWGFVQAVPERNINGNVVGFVGAVSDISDRKLAEERQYQSEQNNRAILAAIPDLLLRVTLDGTCIDYRLPKSSPVDFLPINHHLSEVLPPDILKHELQRIQQARETGELQVWEQKLLRHGVECHEEIRLIPCGDEFLAIVRDISDRKLVEAEIRRSEAHKTALFRALPDLIMRVDRDGTYLEFQATKNFKVIGKTGDFIGTKIEESLPPELAQKRIEMIDIALRTGSIQFYEQDISVGGKMQVEEVRVVPYTDNEVLLLVRDITDRKLVEELLKQNEASLVNAQYIAKMGNWEFDLATQKVTWSEGLFPIYGRNSTEWQPTYAEFKQQVHPDDWEGFEQIIKRAILEGIPYEYEHRVIHPNGSIHYALSKGEVVCNPQGQVIKLVGITQDITETKQSELALHSLLEGTASVTGQEFFPELVKHIAIALDVSQVYLTKRVEENFETLAWYSDHQIQPNLGFKVANTPCELTFQQGSYNCSELNQLFPQDHDLEGINNIDHYLGVAMQNAAGERLGVLSVLNHQPFPNPERAEVILRIFAQRAIAELERLEILEYLQNLNDELEQRVLERTKELEESRNMLQVVLDTIPQRVFWKDRESRFLGCNPSFASDASCSVEFIIGKTDLEMPWAKWADLYRADDAMVMNSRTPKLNYEEPLTNFNGDNIWLRTSKIPLTNKQGELIGILGCYEDISDRKRLEQEQARLTAILEATPDYIGMVNAQGDILWHNQQLRSLCPELGSPDRHRTISDCHPDWANKIIVEQALPSAIQDGSWSGELALLDGIGGEIPVSQVIIVHKSADGTVEHFSTIMRNISDRKQAEKELSQARNFLEAIIENIPLSLFVKNGKEEKFGEFLLWNKTCESMFGLTKEQAIGKSGYDFFPKEQSDFFRQKDRSSFALRKIEDIPEEPIDSLTLGKRILHTIKVPVFDEHGNPDYLICISEDISDRKKVESALTASEAELRSLFAGMDDIVMVLDRMGIYIKIAPTNHHKLYRPANILLGKKIADFFSPMQTDRFLAMIAKTIETQKTQEFEYALVIQDIEYLFNAKCSPLNTDSVVWVARDVSERKQAEIALKASEENFRAVFEQASVGMAQADLNGRFIKLNQRLCDILGFTEAELFNNSFEEITHPDDLAIDHANVKKILAGEKTAFSMEKRYIHKEGHIVWANLDVSIVKSPNGESVSLFGVIQDISDRKQMEKDISTLYEEIWEANSNLETANKQLEAYSTNLENIVDQRTTQLKSAQIQIIAQEKLASLGTLTAGVAHEIRNPLNFVKNYAEGSIELGQELIDTFEPLMPSIDENTSKLIKTLIADLQENSNAIQRHSDRAEKVINSMMQYTRNDNEKIVTQSSDLNALIDQSLKLASFSKLMIDTNFYVAIRTNYAENIDKVDIFPTSFSRAIINIVENACDAMRSKHIKLQSENPDLEYKPTLSISTGFIADLVEIRIRDNGCGIPIDIQSKILDPFFTTKPPGEGTGLGLSITHDIIVNQHQGKIAMDSQLGEYTEILITLPYTKNPQKSSDNQNVW